MRYFLLQNLGYDGIAVNEYKTVEEAKKAYTKTVEEERVWDTKYPAHPSDKGIALISGEVIMSQDEDELYLG